MKRIIFGSISVLLVFAATPPAFAYEKVDASNNSSLTGQSNLLAEVPLPTLQSQNYSSSKQPSARELMTTPSPTSRLQTPKTLQLTQQNPPAEVPSPTLLLYEQQQALMAQMEAMMAQMKVMMEQMKVINATPTRHGVRSSVFQQQTMMAEMKTMMPQMKIMVQAMNGMLSTPFSSNMPSLEKVSDLNSQN